MSSIEYNRYRNFVTNQIRSAKNKYYIELFEKSRKDAKKSWKIINSLLNKNSNSENKIAKLEVDGATLSDGREIAGAFNSFFSTIGEKIANSIPNSHVSHLDFMPNLSVRNSFFFQPILYTDVKNSISRLKNKSCDLNTIPNRVFKYLKELISPILAEIFNKSISNGIFPDCLKIAKVIPVFKTGQKESLNNYRPISILPTMSKIFERIIHTQLSNYFESLKLFSSCQYGFRRLRSTTQAILDNLNYIQEKVDSNIPIISLFLDFKKAFDSVSHNILLSKLSLYGIRGIAHKWFETYLENRKQFTIVNGEKSDLSCLKFGVPQGSILSPLLFLIFINDFPNASPFFKFILFADDSTLTCNSDNFPSQNPIGFINNELEKVQLWLNSNKIKLNIEKSTYLIFSYQKNYSFPAVTINQSILPISNHTKFLGLFIDGNLRYSYHLNTLNPN